MRQSKIRRNEAWWCAICVSAVLVGCGPKERRLTVTATAFNSTVAQTDPKPSESACGAHIALGDRIVAVSRDLVAAGLGCGAEVRISARCHSVILADIQAGLLSR